MKRKSWEEFRDTGLLFYINQILHAFGWAIVFEMENENIIDIYPARVKFRGFSEGAQDKNYKKIAVYMKENSEELLKEITKEE